MPQKQASNAGVVFLTLFLDLVGFSIVFPLFADIVAWYDGHADGMLAVVNSGLTGLVPWADDAQRQALLGGVIFGLFALLQFLCSPLWVALSDRIGRRKVLILTVLGNLLAYVLWALSGSFTLFVLSRILAGSMSGNIAVASAAMADISDDQNRIKRMALIGIAFALGFICGPALGAFAMAALPALPEWQLAGGLAT
ncbi:MAG: MFS transporter, partial [Planctomycetota bacterium]